MANFEKALDYVLNNETIGWPTAGTLDEKVAKMKAGKLSWWFSQTKGDKGGATAFGITLETAKGHGIDTVDKLKAILPNDVAYVYRNPFFWRFDGIKIDSVGAKLMDMRVNMPGEAYSLIQEAFGLPVDNHYGPHTEVAINAAGGKAMALLVQACATHYAKRLRTHPEEEQFRKGWMERAVKVPQ